MFKIIAETAFSHEGDFNYLKQQIHASKDGNVDFVKFQILLSIEDYFLENHQAKETVRAWLFSKEEWIEAFALCKLLNLKVLVLPLEEESLSFCFENKDFIDAIELHSVCFNEISLLTKMKQFQGRVFLGIGGRTAEEINSTLSMLGEIEGDIILQYGFQAFPTNPEEVNLARISKYKQLFKCELGFADHSLYSDNVLHILNSLAYAAGCRYFEKHIVIQKGVKRTDYESAINSKDFIEVFRNLENTVNYIGDGNVFALTDSEQKYKNREKVIVAKRDMAEGHVVTPNDISYKISDAYNTSSITNSNFIIGKILKMNIRKNMIILTSQLNN